MNVVLRTHSTRGPFANNGVQATVSWIDRIVDDYLSDSALSVSNSVPGRINLVN